MGSMGILFEIPRQSQGKRNMIGFICLIWFRELQFYDFRLICWHIFNFIDTMEM